MMMARAVKPLLATALNLALVSGIEVANAKVVRWDLQNVTFGVGGNATGFFLFDADAPHNHQVVGWDITLGAVSSAWPFPPYRFTPDSASVMGGNVPVAPGVGDFVFGGFIVYSSQSFYPDDRNILQLSLEFARQLSDAGGTVALRTIAEGNSYVAFSYPYEGRGLTTGYLVAIPEPTTLLFSVGLWGLGLAWRRTFTDQR